MKIQFFVPGQPAPGGSKKGFVRGGKVCLVDDAKGNRDWKSRVASCASEAYPGPLLEGPLEVAMIFTLLRPTTVKRLYPTVRPDVLKLARSTEDALTGVVWRDDCLTIELSLSKRYGAKPGALISVWERD